MGEAAFTVTGIKLPVRRSKLFPYFGIVYTNMKNMIGNVILLAELFLQKTALQPVRNHYKRLSMDLFFVSQVLFVTNPQTIVG